MMESSIVCLCPQLNADETFNQINFDSNFMLNTMLMVYSQSWCNV